MKNGDQSLSEACSGLFLYLTTFRRNAATSTQSVQDLHHLLRKQIDELRARCDEDTRLGPLFERVFYALVAAADQVVIHSKWPQRVGWQMNLLETHYFGRAEGGKRFYQDMEKIVDDPTAESAELSEVLFTCLALGFEGMLQGERRELERKRRQLFDRARLAEGVEGQLTPMAYGRNALRENTKLPTVELLRTLAATLVALLFFVFAGQLVTGCKTGKASERIEKLELELEGRAAGAAAGQEQDR